MGVIHETSVRVAKKREIRTEAILDAAMAIVAKEGLERLTLGRLAETLGYVPAALYRYFGSKDALLAALQRRAVAKIGVTLHSAITAIDERATRESPKVASLAVLVAAARVYSELPATHPDEWFLVAVLLGDPRVLLSDEESQKTMPLLAALLGAVQTRFVRAAEVKALTEGDATSRTIAFWAALQGVQTLAKARRIAPDFPDATAVTEVAISAMLAGWGADPSALDAAKEIARFVPETWTGGSR